MNKKKKRSQKDIFHGRIKSTEIYLFLLTFFFICSSIVAIAYMTRVYLDVSTARRVAESGIQIVGVPNSSASLYYPIFPFED